jgi:hypothetical protein
MLSLARHLGHVAAPKVYRGRWQTRPRTSLKPLVYQQHLAEHYDRRTQDGASSTRCMESVDRISAFFCDKTGMIRDPAEGVSW